MNSCAAEDQSGDAVHRKHLSVKTIPKHNISYHSIDVDSSEVTVDGWIARLQGRIEISEEAEDFMRSNYFQPRGAHADVGIFIGRRLKPHTKWINGNEQVETGILSTAEACECALQLAGHIRRSLRVRMIILVHNGKFMWRGKPRLLAVTDRSLVSVLEESAFQTSVDTATAIRLVQYPIAN